MTPLCKTESSPHNQPPSNMIKKIKIQRWIPSLIAAVALAGSAGLCQAQSVITYDFASDLQGWSGNEPAGFPATYSWNATNGSTGGGCMQVVFGYPVGTAAATNEMDPWVTLPSTLNELQYLSVSIHMKVDPSSGVTGNMGSGGYGNLPRTPVSTLSSRRSSCSSSSPR